jgi:hypothetical protein
MPAHQAAEAFGREATVEDSRLLLLNMSRIHARPAVVIAGLIRSSRWLVRAPPGDFMLRLPWVVLAWLLNGCSAHRDSMTSVRAGPPDSDAADVTRLVGICLLIQPQLAAGAVIVVGAVVVATAISAEIEAARAKKPGCRCKCLKEGDGAYFGFSRVASPAVCANLCRNHPNGYTGSVCQ